MHSCQLRIYTLRTRDAFARYTNTTEPRHLRSTPSFGQKLHDFWTKEEDVTPRLVALVAYAEGDA